MIKSMDKTDAELKNDVLSELKYEPSVKATDIGVLVKAGAVTLNGALLDANKIRAEVSGNRVILHGKVQNHVERVEAERVAWSAPGVKAVENLLGVDWPRLSE